MIHTQSTIAQKELLIDRILRDGTYAVESILGEGGMSTVYLARHTTLHIPFALKQDCADYPLPENVIAELDATLQQRGNKPQEKNLHAAGFPDSGGPHTDCFLREALLLSRLHHPALPALYDYFFEDGYWYLVLEYLPGQPLNRYIQEHAPLPPLEALSYALQLCAILEYLHTQNPPIVFRDLKPTNILLDTDKKMVYLLDFGIARYLDSAEEDRTLEPGSPAYASPEQYQHQLDLRSDLFSLGIILYEMLYGKRPDGHSTNTTVRLSHTLQGLLALATAADPDARIQSTRDFSQALQQAYLVEQRGQDKPVQAPPLPFQQAKNEKRVRKIRRDIQRACYPMGSESFTQQLTSVDQSLKLRALRKQEAQTDALESTNTGKLLRYPSQATANLYTAAIMAFHSFQHWLLARRNKV